MDKYTLVGACAWEWNISKYTDIRFTHKRYETETKWNQCNENTQILNWKMNAKAAAKKEKWKHQKQKINKTCFYFDNEQTNIMLLLRRQRRLLFSECKIFRSTAKCLCKRACVRTRARACLLVCVLSVWLGGCIYQKVLQWVCAWAWIFGSSNFDVRENGIRSAKRSSLNPTKKIEKKTHSNDEC